MRTHSNELLTSTAILIRQQPLRQQYEDVKMGVPKFFRWYHPLLLELRIHAYGAQDE